MTKNKIDNIRQMTLAMAALSPCKKRRVGAIVVDKYHNVLSKGYNYIKEGGHELDEDGETTEDVVHAEVAAIEKLEKGQRKLATKIYTSHAPCNNCKVAIIAAGIHDTEVVEEFMKFDGDKVRYDLVAPCVIKAIARVFTYGARKYKPKNYLQCKDRERFVAAFFRHFEAWREGETIDPESQLSHLDHAMCNLAILKEFEELDNIQPELDLSEQARDLVSGLNDLAQNNIRKGGLIR